MLFPKFSTHLILTTASICLLTVPAYSQDNQDKTDPPPWSMADKYWGKEAMAKSRAAVQAANGAQMNYMVMADRLELQFGDEDTLLWDLQGWYGGDVNKFYVKTEGAYSFENDEVEEAEIQALWSRAVAPFWDVQAGIRQDLEPEGKTHAVIGIQGLAPYWFEVDAAAFVSTDGDVTARVETEYELLLTQRLVLQPRMEVEFAAQDIPDLEIGSGVTSLDAGLRLRYEFKREFAPYVGVEWQKSVGNTADIVKAAGGETDNTVFVFGVRTWF